MEDTVRICDIEESTARLKRIGSALRVLFLMLAGIAALASATIVAAPFLYSDNAALPLKDLPRTLLVFFYLILLAMVFLLLSGMFADIARGTSPFSTKQVRRLRAISALFLVAFFMDAIAPLGASVIGSGASLETRAVADEYLSFKVNPLILSCSIFFFALSFVFKYGSLLQSLSDDTV